MPTTGSRRWCRPARQRVHRQVEEGNAEIESRGADTGADAGVDADADADAELMLMLLFNAMFDGTRISSFLKRRGIDPE